MSKLYLALSLFFITSKIFTLTPYSFYDVGNFGVEMDNKKWFEMISWNASFPSIYVRDRDSGLGIGIQSILYSSETLLDDASLSFFDTQLYWTPFLDNELDILGPYVEVSSDLEQFEWDLHVGLKYSHFITILDKRFPSKFVYRPLDIEFGYSIVNDEFHVGYKLDLTIGLKMLQESLESQIRKK